ncbi:plastocyanin/azurin family copper-binding protein [Arhodomonas sp. SL1]|uniref:plastocyanin/azurin family copper-binding protein n=1 Tax=Arhodomonas sp. SL1 TaxID=3425691 RepID=UPI003F883862
MTLTRRRLLALGGGGFAALAIAPWLRAARTHTVTMQGDAAGAHVWFTPTGLAVSPGDTVRFVNADTGNSHTATAYHPGLFGRPRRIPAQASAFHSDYLLPGADYAVTLIARGVYDYYCVPHELAGMVGRIVVGAPGEPGWQPAAPVPSGPRAAILSALPGVDAILAQGKHTSEADA